MGLRPCPPNTTCVGVDEDEEEVVGRGLGRGWRLMPAREGGGVRRGLKENERRGGRLACGGLGRGDVVHVEEVLVGCRKDRHDDGGVVLPLLRRRDRADVMVNYYCVSLLFVGMLRVASLG